WHSGRCAPACSLPTQSPDSLDLLFRSEHAALELQRAEAVPLDHPPGLLDDPVGIHRLAPRIDVEVPGMLGPLVKEVRTEVDPLPHRTPEQVDDPPAGRL